MHSLLKMDVKGHNFLSSSPLILRDFLSTVDRLVVSVMMGSLGQSTDPQRP